jgi:hypothetical protein
MEMKMLLGSTGDLDAMHVVGDGETSNMLRYGLKIYLLIYPYMRRFGTMEFRLGKGGG